VAVKGRAFGGLKSGRTRENEREKGGLRPAVQQKAASFHDGGGYNEYALDIRYCQ
jgi:hypothetical protein